MYTRYTCKHSKNLYMLLLNTLPSFIKCVYVCKYSSTFFYDIIISSISCVVVYGAPGEMFLLVLIY